jgi:hypothetical protein
MKLSKEFENLNPETKEFIKELATYIEKRRQKMSYRNYSPRLSSFAEVEATYNDVKPMVSKNHTKEQNLRPIGDRARKWERVIKVNDKKYILNNGEVDMISFWGGYHHNQAKRKPTMEEVEALAPIVWTIDDEGNEFIKIRNGSGESAHMSRYTFLEHNLPKQMAFIVDNGKQYIAIGDKFGGSQHFLPKSDYFWGNKNSKEDGKQLHFVRMAGTTKWLPEGNTFQFTSPKKRIDKARKVKLKGAIDSMWDYIGAMWQLINFNDSYDYNRHTQLQDEMYKAFADWSGEPKQESYWWDWKGKGDFIAHVFETEEHPCRVNLLEMFVRDSDLRWVGVSEDTRRHYGRRTEVDEKEFLSKVRSQYNRWVNKALEIEYLHSEASVVEVKGDK